MRIQILFVVVFIFLLRATYAASGNKQQYICLTDTLPSTAKCLTLDQLIQITQLETKSATSILNLLQQADNSWEHKGTDKAEIVFAVKAKLKYILNWRRKEQALILYFFSTPEYEKYNRQIIAGDFQFVREETDPAKLAFKIYKKDKLIVKIGEIFLKSPGNNYLLSVQVGGG